MLAGLADHYRIERELGRGGMATELAATLRPERFQREIKVAARLDELLFIAGRSCPATLGVIRLQCRGHNTRRQPSAYFLSLNRQ
jgi:hypothetical protein